MESKFSAGMFTGLGNFLISSECYHFISQLLVTMHVQWLVHCHFFSHPIYCKSLQLILPLSEVFSFSCLMQMTVLVVYIFLYGRVYLVIDIFYVHACYILLQKYEVFMTIWKGKFLFLVSANASFYEYIGCSVFM